MAVAVKSKSRQPVCYGKVCSPDTYYSPCMAVEAIFRA